MIKIKNASLAASAVSKKQYPELLLPEIVLLGRSNSGKSSLINTLINRKNLARTSGQPGKTRLINFYLIEGCSDQLPIRWYFVDLPGYGYAKVSKSQRAEWLTLIEEYLETRRERVYCWQLVDSRHLPSEEDQAMCQVLIEGGYPLQLIANKVDKLSKNAVTNQIRLISQTLGVPAQELQTFSAITRIGSQELLKLAEQWILAQD
ncbi:MAG: ribosome biogenesis GTP-binding protein YihA/YsxC [Clostridiales bacterium]